MEPRQINPTSTPGRIAVVGAGVAGLACARTLCDQGVDVTVLDRGRGPGGRASTRRPPGGLPGSFDHGAPFFSVRDESFERTVLSWTDAGICAWWSPRRAAWRDGALSPVASAERLAVGVPGMSAVSRHLARGLDLRLSSSVTSLARDGARWRLAIEAVPDGASSSEGPFDAVVLATPAPQAVRLLPPTEPLAAPLSDLSMLPTWVAMLEIDDPMDDRPEVIDLVDDSALALLIRDDAKPGRTRDPGRSRWVVHARPDWSNERYDAPRSEVAAALVAAACRVFSTMNSIDLGNRVPTCIAHRWGLARPAATRPESCLADPDRGLIACGDGFGGEGVEGAYLSGIAGAARALS